MSKATKKVLITFFLVFSILAGIKAVQIYFAIKNSQFTPPPEAVTSYIASYQEWKDMFYAVGTVRSVNGAMLSTQVAGTVVSVNFKPGQFVEKNTVLVELDSGVEKAELKGALALESRTKNALERAKVLREKNAISKDEFDNAVSDYDRASSAVESLKASILRKSIVATVSGNVGVRSVNEGDYLEAGTNVVSVHDLSEVFINFSLPQKFANELYVGALAKVWAEDGNKIDAKVVAFDSDIAIDTRTLRVQALANNANNILKPGMFVSVALELKGISKGVIIPTSAINYAPYGNSIYLVIDGPHGAKTVEQKFVKIGGQRGDFVQILSGLEEGNEVVTSGLFKLRPGSLVLINNGPDNKFANQYSLEPKPSDS